MLWWSPAPGVPVQLFAARHRDGRCAFHGVEQLGEGFGSRGRVVMQQPDPLRGRSAAGSAAAFPSGGEGAEPGLHRGAHAAAGVVEDGDVGLAEGLFKEGCGMVAGTGINPDAGVRGPGLGRQRREGPG